MRRIVNYLVVFLLIPLLVLVGFFLYDDKQYNLISILIALLSCAPFILSFEKRTPQARELVLVATLTAIAVVSRMAFFLTPGFKPVVAFVIIVAFVFGKEMGFMVGALSALLSNVYFGQGPHTPFQMFSWGFIGFVAGVIGRYKFFNNLYMIIVYGALSGLLFSLIMDIHTMLFIYNSFSFSRYLAIAITSSPFTVAYVTSNIIFLLFLQRPISKKLFRIKEKYGLYK